MLCVVSDWRALLNAIRNRVRKRESCTSNGKLKRPRIPCPTAINSSTTLTNIVLFQNSCLRNKRVTQRSKRRINGSEHHKRDAINKCIVIYLLSHAEFMESCNIVLFVGPRAVERKGERQYSNCARSDHSFPYTPDFFHRETGKAAGPAFKMSPFVFITN